MRLTGRADVLPLLPVGTSAPVGSWSAATSRSPPGIWLHSQDRRERAGLTDQRGDGNDPELRPTVRLIPILFGPEDGAGWGVVWRERGWGEEVDQRSLGRANRRAALSATKGTSTRSRPVPGDP